VVLLPDGDDVDLLLLDGDVTVLLVDLDSEETLLLYTLLSLLEDVVADLIELLVLDLLVLDLLTEPEVLGLEVLDSEETLLLDTDLLGDDVSTLLDVTVLSGVEPLLLSVPFTCLLGLNSSTLLGLGSGLGGLGLCGGLTTAVRG